MDIKKIILEDTRSKENLNILKTLLDKINLTIESLEDLEGIEMG